MDLDYLKKIIDLKDKVSLDVPAKLISYTVGHEDLTRYNDSGMQAAMLLSIAVLNCAGLKFDHVKNCLDFGCGSGRLLEKMPFGIDTKVFGCDVNGEAIGYAQSALTNCSLYKNELMPPLIYKNDFFDLIYSFSVFSHLSLEVEEKWLSELARVGKSGCIYAITIHGDYWIEATLQAESELAKEAGFYYKIVHPEGTFPSYYEASFHTSKFIFNNWNKYFDILQVVSGRSSQNELYDPVSNKLLESVGSLGQDIVIARKR
jgi:SAM-dependent methyltransferase